MPANQTISGNVFNLYGNSRSEEIAERPVKKSPSTRAGKLRELYLQAKSSASMEFPYWYTRRWEELDGEITIVRRAAALKAGFEHLTPTIFPGELLVMGKTRYLRGSYPLPWLSESFFLAAEDDLYKQALKDGKASADTVTTMGQGGGNVTHSEGNVISIAGKFGIRKEEMPVLLKTARKWHNKSVDDIGHRNIGVVFR